VLRTLSFSQHRQSHDDSAMLYWSILSLLMLSDDNGITLVWLNFYKHIVDPQMAQSVNRNTKQRAT
jgi:hypothetical protein